jgi:D-amino-acid dehydrogenase
VIGAGVIGVTTAYGLASRGRDVTVIDAGPIGHGSSYGNAGLVSPSHSLPLATPGVLGQGLRWLLDRNSPFYIKPRFDRALLSWLWHFRAAANEKQASAAIPLLRSLHLASRDLYDEWTALDGMDCAYARNGLLYVFRTHSGLHEAREEARLLQDSGLTSEFLDEDAVREIIPLLRAGAAGGVRFSEDAQMNPHTFVTGLARLAESAGATFLERTEALGFTTASGRITAVNTTRGEFRPAQVVLAAGAWSPGVARDLRLKLPIQAAKGYSLTFHRPDPFPDIPLLLMEARVAVTPMGPLLRLAGTLEMSGMDLSINRRRVDAMKRAASDYLEGIDQLELLEIWRGLRPCTPDGLPIVGRPPHWENLVIAAGHAMIGQSLGPITGEIVARLICDEDPAFDLHLLGYQRFA